MAKQTFTTGQVLTAAQMTSLQQTAMGGGSATAKVASYVLVAADAGTTVIMNAAGATTITVNTSLFAAGDTVLIQNIGAGTCTVTAGTATVSTAGSLALTQYEAGILYFTAAGTALFHDYVQTSSAAAFVGVALTATGAQAIANATNTFITFNVEDFDTDAFHSTSSNTTRITIPAGKGGKYQFTSHVLFDSTNGTGRRLTFFAKNGTELNKTHTELGPVSGSSIGIVNSVLVDLVATDYIEILAYQTSGGSISTDGASCSFSAVYLGA